MDAHELLALAQRYTDAWNTHDATAAADCFSDDGSLAINGGEPAVGRAAIQAAMQRFHDAYTDSVFTLDAVRGAGDQAVLLWTYEGTNMASEGTSNRVRVSGWDAWTLSPRGLVQRSVGNFDHN